MSRNDISNFVIHFTKGNSDEDAFKRLQKILWEQTLLGSGRLIKGGYPCVCFSEAPLTALTNGLVNPEYYSKYSAFGIMVQKQWLFDLGGRHVIYEPDVEFGGLADCHKWRHMRYEPPDVDFAWEREWRIRCDSLRFDCQCASVIVLDESWGHRLVQEHECQQDSIIMQYSMIMDDTIAQLYRQPFVWKFLTLR